MNRGTMPARMATVIVALAVVATPLALAGTASAATPADTVIASDPTPGPQAAPEPATAQRVVGIDASLVNGLSISGAKGAAVTVTARGEKPRTMTPKANAPAVFRQLTPGVTYTVAIGGTKVGTGVPVAAVGPAYGLTVSTTATADEVLLRWSQQPTRGQGTAVSYDVVATPIGTIGRSTADAAQVEGTTTATVTTIALDPTVMYTFTVTPRNSASTGQATAATMTRTLAEMGGAASVPTTQTPAPAPTPTPAPTPAPSPAPAPAPAPAPGPSTKTVYLCPAGFSENATGVCEKLTPYTFTSTAYTFHLENIYGYGQVDWAYTWGHCTGSGKSGNWENGDPYCQTAVYGNNAIIGSQSVKDSTPAGYTDNGSTWMKKDTLPAGYTDNGTQWVATTAKVATIVPA